MKSVFKYALAILSVLADILSIVAFVGISGTSNLQLTLPPNIGIILWGCSLVSFLVALVFYLDEFPHRYGISVSLFVFIYYHVILKRENKLFMIYLLILLASLALVSLEILQAFFLILFIFGTSTVMTYYQTMSEASTRYSKFLDEIFDDISRIVGNRKYVYLSDLKVLSVKYQIPRLFFFKIMHLLAAYQPEDYSFGFLIDSTGKRSPIRLLVSLAALSDDEKVVV